MPRDFYKLRLYLRGDRGQARANLERFCEERLGGRYSLEIVDVDRDPDRAEEDDIIAIPTLVRVAPGPTRRLIGDFSNTARLAEGLDVPPQAIAAADEAGASWSQVP